MPVTFKAGQHEFTLALNYTKARAIRETLQLDFVDFDGICKTLVRVQGDLDLLMQTLWSFLEQQAKAKSLDESKFGELFTDGETFKAARVALAECAINFSDPLIRDELRKAIAAVLVEFKTIVEGWVEKRSP